MVRYISKSDLPLDVKNTVHQAPTKQATKLFYTFTVLDAHISCALLHEHHQKYVPSLCPHFTAGNTNLHWFLLHLPKDSEWHRSLNQKTCAVHLKPCSVLFVIAKLIISSHLCVSLWNIKCSHRPNHIVHQVSKIQKKTIKADIRVQQ